MPARAPGWTPGYIAALDVLIDSERVPMVDGTAALLEARRYDGGDVRIAWAIASQRRQGEHIERGRYRCLPGDLRAIAAGCVRLAARMEHRASSPTPPPPERIA